MVTALDSRRVLVAEDEGLIAFDIERGLTKKGYFVSSVVSTGEEAIAQADLFSPDLVLMDITLKGAIDGIEAARKVHEKLHIPVVFLTGHADEATLARALEAEPYGYVLKPFEPTELHAVLETAFNRLKLEARANSSEPERESRLEPSAMSDLAEQPRVHRPAPRVLTRATKTLKQPISSEEDVAGFLSEISPFSALAQQELNDFVRLCQVVTTHGGELLSCEGDEVSSSFLVLHGRVSFLKTSANGKELIVELVPPGDILPIILGCNSKTAAYTARSPIASQLVRFPLPAFAALLDRNTAMYRSFMEEISIRLQASHEYARGLAHDRVEVRIATALCALIPSFAEQRGDHVVIRMTRQELADLTGTTPETAIRTTKAMERMGILSFQKPGEIGIVSMDGLRVLAE